MLASSVSGSDCAGHLVADFGDRDRLTERVADDASLPRAAGQQRVARVLEARQPAAFGADHAEHLCRERPARIDAAHHRRAQSRRGFQREDRVRLPGRHGPGEVDEAAALR